MPGIIIAMFSHKGGTGKSTLTLNISSMFTNEASNPYFRFKSCLMLDCDPQMSLTRYCLDEKEFDDHLMLELNKDQSSGSFKSVIKGEDVVKVEHSHNGAHKTELIKGSFEDPIFDTQIGNELFINTIGMYVKSIITNIRRLRDQADIIFLDLSPSMNPLNIALLLSSDYVLCPLRSDVFCEIHFDLLHKNLYDRFKNTSIQAHLPKVIGFILNQARHINGDITLDCDNFRSRFNTKCTKYGWPSYIYYLEDLSGWGVQLQLKQETIARKLEHMSTSIAASQIQDYDKADVKKQKRCYQQLLYICKEINQRTL